MGLPAGFFRPVAERVVRSTCRDNPGATAAALPKSSRATTNKCLTCIRPWLTKLVFRQQKGVDIPPQADILRRVTDLYHSNTRSSQYYCHQPEQFALRLFCTNGRSSGSWPGRLPMSKPHNSTLEGGTRGKCPRFGGRRRGAGLRNRSIKPDLATPPPIPLAYDVCRGVKVIRINEHACC